MSNSAELMKKLKTKKPCEFCATHWAVTKCSQFKWDGTKVVKMTVYSIMCNECNRIMNYFDSEEDAIKAWNRRVEK